jgi:uncharacterized membrane protein YkvA (DUF1232 family)
MIGLLRRGFDEEVTAGGLTDALRRHAADVPVDDVENLAISLERFLRAVPDALATALAMSKDPRCGASVAFATGPILNYVLDEEDLLPEASFGALGLLDDAYLVHVFVAMLRQTYPYVETPAAYATPEQQTLEMVASSSRRALPTRCSEHVRARSTSPRRCFLQYEERSRPTPFFTRRSEWARRSASPVPRPFTPSSRVRRMPAGA